MNRRRGTTLVELMVALTILALSAGIATLAIHSLRPTPTSEIRAALLQARTRAIRDGHPVRMTIDTRGDSTAPRLLLFLPDGRTLGQAANDSE